MKLPNIRGKFKLNYPLGSITWFKVGGEAEFFFKPQDASDLAEALKWNSQQASPLPITIIGACSNLLVRDGGVRGIVIKLGQAFTNIRLKDAQIEVGAGCLNFNLAKFCAVNGIKGLEFLVGIPGTIGGGIRMNAGCYDGDYASIITKVEAIDYSGNHLEFTPEEIGFRYRHNSLPQNLIFTKATMKAKLGDCKKIKAKMAEITSKRAATQPITERTSGSTFKNPNGNKAWQLIDEAGLRGHRIGDAAFSNKHCNFMINCGQALASDFEALGQLAISRVKRHSNVTLEWEIKRIGQK